jgi:transposase InsO family protein
MSSTSSLKTIEVLRSLFARYGLPEQFVTDNGPQFSSAEFANFMKGNGIKRIISAPYHPASNGFAERFVQTLKQALKAGEKDGKNIDHHLAEFLFEYRATPHATTNV